MRSQAVAKLVTYMIGACAMILAAIAYWASVYFAHRYSISSFPGNNELLEGAGMGLLVGAPAAAIAVIAAFILGKVGETKAARWLGRIAIVLSGLVFAWYWYVVS